jgi:hypothetical protein
MALDIFIVTEFGVGLGLDGMTCCKGHLVLLYCYEIKREFTICDFLSLAGTVIFRGCSHIPTYKVVLIQVTDVPAAFGVTAIRLDTTLKRVDEELMHYAVRFSSSVGEMLIGPVRPCRRKAMMHIQLSHPIVRTTSLHTTNIGSA